MGGQTALNLAIDCQSAGIWDIFDVEMISSKWEAHQSGAKDYGNQVWALLVFLDWAKERHIEW